MQPATPFPGGYVPAVGPFAMQAAVGAATTPQQTMHFTGPMPPSTGGVGARGRKGFQHFRQTFGPVSISIWNLWLQNSMIFMTVFVCLFTEHMTLHMFGSRFDVSGSTDHRESNILSAIKDIWILSCSVWERWLLLPWILPQLLHASLSTQRQPLVQPVGQRLCLSLDMEIRSVIGYVDDRGQEIGVKDRGVPQQSPEPYPWVLKKQSIGLRP